MKGNMNLHYIFKAAKGVYSIAKHAKNNLQDTMEDRFISRKYVTREEFEILQDQLNELRSKTKNKTK
ncbi:MAG: hypothetical protein AB8B67_02545 [Rickettsiaceae bacterium]